MTTVLENPTTAAPAEVLILRRAAQHLITCGYHKGDYAPKNRLSDPTAPCCVAGAINVASGGTPDSPGRRADDAKYALASHLDLLQNAPITAGGLDLDEALSDWSDAPDRSGREVVSALLTAAACVEAGWKP